MTMQANVAPQPGFNQKSSKPYLCRILILVCVVFGITTISMSPPLSPKDTEPFAPKSISLAQTAPAGTSGTPDR